MELAMRWASNLIALLLFSLPFASSQDTSRQLSGASVKDYALLGYNFASFSTGDPFSCAHRCLSRDQCKSYNYAVHGPQQGLCELNGVGRDGPALKFRPGFVFVEALMRKPLKPKKSCLDHLRAGSRTSGVYQLEVDSDNSFAVYCDFHSESGWVWTLVMSQSYANRAETQFRHRSFSQNAPVDEENPNWEAYRLSFNRMDLLKTQSTHWRATCNFPTYGRVDYRDYVRADFSEFDLLSFEGGAVCKKVEYMNVRGHSCTECTSSWWQMPYQFPAHHDSSFNLCGFGSTPDAVSSEDNFGFYASTNPSFRCSNSDSANTNHWLGRRV